MKKVIYILAILISLALQVSPAMAAAGTFALSPASGTFNKGCSFSVDILINTGGVTSDGADAVISYDATRLTVSSINTGKTYAAYPTASADPQTGKIAILAVAAPGQTYNGSGVFATLNMTVTANAPAGSTQLKFDYTNGETNDSNIGTVQNGTIVDNLGGVTNGTYTIGTGACGASSLTGGQGSTGISTPTAQPKTLDEFVDVKKKGPGDHTTMMIITGVGGILTILGVIGMALL